MRLANLTATSTLTLPPNTYIYKITPVATHLLAAISSDDSLRLIDPSTLQEITISSGGGGGVLHNVHSGVTSLQAMDNDPNGLLTAGRDGLVCRYDLRIGMKKTMQFSDGQFIIKCPKIN